MEQLAVAKAKEGYVSATEQLKSLQLQETQRMSSSRIWWAHGKGRNRGIVTVIAKYEKGKWQEINDRLGMEKACMVENKARFSQATKA